jgi:hypothetical protein
MVLRVGRLSYASYVKVATPTNPALRFTSTGTKCKATYFQAHNFPLTDSSLYNQADTSTITMSELLTLPKPNGPQSYDPVTGANKTVAEYLAQTSPTFVRPMIAREKVVAPAVCIILISC